MSNHRGKHGVIINSYFDVQTEPSKGMDIYKEGDISLLGQVERIHFVDDSTNISKEFVEYDVSVRDAYGGQSTFKNVRASMGIAGGLSDYDEIILEDNEVALQGKLDTSNPFKNKNGTVVIVEFINNSLDKPYISNVLGHPSSSAASRSDGIRRKGEFRGLGWEINSKGELTITYRGSRKPNGDLEREDTGPTEIKIDENGNLSVSNNESQGIEINRVDKKITVTDGTNTVTIEKDSNKIALVAGSTLINIDGSSGKIELTGSLVDVGEAASALAVLGPQLISWLSSHTHNAPQAPSGTLPTTPPLVPPPSSLLSTSVKVKS